MKLMLCLSVALIAVVWSLPAAACDCMSLKPLDCLNLLQLRRQREDPGIGPVAIGNSGDNPYQSPAGLDSMSSADCYRDQS